MGRGQQGPAASQVGVSLCNLHVAWGMGLARTRNDARFSAVTQQFLFWESTARRDVHPGVVRSVPGKWQKARATQTSVENGRAKSTRWKARGLFQKGTRNLHSLAG